MHVGLNLVFLVPGATGGTETYARELIPELVKAAPETRFTAFVNREAATAGGGPWGEIIPAVTVPVEAANRIRWVEGEQLHLPRLAKRGGVDLVHSLANTAPVWGAFRRITTIHDLAFRMVPGAHLSVLGLGMRVLVPLAARRSHRIIVSAQSARHDLELELRVRPEKIDVVPLGLGTEARAAPLPQAEVRNRLDAGDRAIVLCVAAKRPHKNLLRLIDALALIPGERRPLLVLAGYPTAHVADLHHRTTELGLMRDVRILDWVPPEELEGLYGVAACFVFPSLMEGFGLPVLEAMARGVPVACSSRGALAEVAGDAALRFDPESEPAIAAAIERLLGSPEEAQRLREAGRSRAATYSWQATAAATVNAYRQTFAESVPARLDRRSMRHG